MKKKKTRCYSSIHGVYAITDASISDTTELVSQVRSAIAGNISVLQYRAKGIPPELAEKNAFALARLCRDSNITFIINDNVDLACEVGADGVHIGKDDADLELARRKLGDRIIGVSCYNNVTRAQDMVLRGVDYVAFGRFFPSKTKPDAEQADIEILCEAHTRLSVPVVAIGGITPENAAMLIRAGANAIAVVDGIFGQRDIESSCLRYAKLFN